HLSNVDTRKSLKRFSAVARIPITPQNSTRGGVVTKFCFSAVARIPITPPGTTSSFVGRLGVSVRLPAFQSRHTIYIPDLFQVHTVSVRLPAFQSRHKSKD